MDITELITRLSNTYVSNESAVASYTKTIIDSIIQASEEGCNSLVYEIITLSDNDIKQIRAELLTLFPDMDITITDKRLVIDWS